MNPQVIFGFILLILAIICFDEAGAAELKQVNVEEAQQAADLAYRQGWQEGAQYVANEVVSRCAANGGVVIRDDDGDVAYVACQLVDQPKQ